MRTIPPEQLEANSAEAEDFAAGVFARISAAGTRSRTRERVSNRRSVQPKQSRAVEKQRWFSGVEAGLPNGDRD